MKRLTGLLASVVLASPCTAAADDLIVANAPQPVFVDGRLQGCSIDFYGVRDDPEYLMRPQAVVSGSIGFYAAPERLPVLTVKLGLAPYVEQGTLVFRAPTQVVFVLRYQTNIADVRMSQPSPDSPGFTLTAFRLSDLTTTILANSTETGRFEIGYALAANGTNARFVVDLARQSPDGPRDERATQRWQECVDQVIQLAAAE